jgi:hypothetical protein
LTELTDRAYDDLIGSQRYSYAAFISELDALLERHASRQALASKEGYCKAIQEPLPRPPWWRRVRHHVKRVLIALQLWQEAA